MKGGKKAERKIIMNHTGEADAGDITLKLLKLMAHSTKGCVASDGREAEQHRNLRQDKQR